MPPVAIIGVVAAATLFVDAVGLYLVRRLVPKGRTANLAVSVIRNVRHPVTLLLPLVGIDIAVAAVPLSSPLRSDLLHAISSALIVAVAFVVVRLTYVLDDVVLFHYRVDVADNLRARRIQTQLQILRRVTVMAVGIIAVAAILLSFPSVRAAGAGLLASAGLIGVVGGLAAKPTVANVVAGVQIALSQPIRVDDVVVVEGHWGRIEDIALTYVVIRVWDLRRLVVPISYFVSNPFENWTRTGSDILGWVNLEVDFSTPVDEVREEFQRILSGSSDWDGNVAVLQVSDSDSTTMRLRALMSSADSSRSWNLQCDVREKLIAYLDRYHPEALPRLRGAAAEGPRPPIVAEDTVRPLRRHQTHPANRGQR